MIWMVLFLLGGDGTFGSLYRRRESVMVVVVVVVVDGLCVEYNPEYL